MNTLATASAGIYQVLLLVYPQQFRRRYGAEMTSVFFENCRYTCHSRGFLAVIGLWLSTLQDLLISASAEHLASFICQARSDVRAISRAPMFVAASGALVGALFFIHTAFVRTIWFHDAATLPQLNSIVIAGVNIASLWLASGIALYFLRQVVGDETYDQMPFVSRLRAFNHLASVFLVLAVSAILKYPLTGALRERFSLQLLGNPQHWLVFPLVVVCTVSSVILLDPLLTLRSSVSKASNRKPVATASILRLSLANISDEHKL
jgi:hypothetical protein